MLTLVCVTFIYAVCYIGVCTFKFWARFGNAWGSFWERLRVVLICLGVVVVVVVILGPFWARSGVVLASFWCRFGVVGGSLGDPSGTIGASSTFVVVLF